jgi:SAM-dependent methyltransferase
MARDFAPAAERNKVAIRDVLAEVLPASGLVLEIACGTGQHAAFFGASFPALTWQPTDLEPNAAGVRECCQAAGADNVLDAIRLDAALVAWPVERADAIVNINMIHIAPWAACLGLLAGAGRVLPAGAPLVLYGPYRVDGAFNAPSNASFDQSLRRMDPAWGVRELRDVEAEAAAHGLSLERIVDMPANNYSVVFRRQ